MTLKVLIGCKRVIDYAVKVSFLIINSKITLFKFNQGF